MFLKSKLDFFCKLTTKLTNKFYEIVFYNILLFKLILQSYNFIHENIFIKFSIILESNFGLYTKVF